MKGILYVLVAIVITASCKSGDSNQTVAPKKNSTTEINWMTIEEAEKATKSNPKDIYVMVYADWCPKCEKFNTTTYKDPKVIKDLNENFYPVKLNAQESKEIMFNGKKYGNPNFDASKGKMDRNSYHELLFEIDAKSIPSIVVLDKELNVTGSEMGYQEAGVLRSLLKMYASR